jgi:hypothetical protein
MYFITKLIRQTVKYILKTMATIIKNTERVFDFVCHLLLYYGWSEFVMKWFDRSSWLSGFSIDSDSEDRDTSLYLSQDVQ